MKLKEKLLEAAIEKVHAGTQKLAAKRLAARCRRGNRAADWGSPPAW